jgi:hypothetical protein
MFGDLSGLMLHILTLKMKAACFSETFVSTCKNTWYHCHEDLKVKFSSVCTLIYGGLYPIVQTSQNQDSWVTEVSGSVTYMSTKPVMLLTHFGDTPFKSHVVCLSSSKQILGYYLKLDHFFFHNLSNFIIWSSYYDIWYDMILYDTTYIVWSIETVK